jgi:hypothetical protein
MSASPISQPPRLTTVTTTLNTSNPARTLRALGQRSDTSRRHDLWERLVYLATTASLNPRTQAGHLAGNGQHNHWLCRCVLAWLTGREVWVGSSLLHPWRGQQPQAMGSRM